MELALAVFCETTFLQVFYSAGYAICTGKPAAPARFGRCGQYYFKVRRSRSPTRAKIHRQFANLCSDIANQIVLRGVLEAG